MNQPTRRNRMFIGRIAACVLLFSLSASSSVFIQWSTPDLPPASSLGVSNIVFSWKQGIAPSVVSARKQGYRVYVAMPLQQAKAAAEEGLKSGWEGIMLEIPESERAASENSIASLRSAYPKLRFLVPNSNGKQPLMRGSIIIKRDSVLEVSSPTAQPWIDSNLALIKVEERSRPGEVPLYSFAWADQGQKQVATAIDYSLAVAEAGAFHADLLLQLDEHLQRSISAHEAESIALWNEVRSLVKFYADRKDLKPAANVAVVVDHLDANDEVLNLLARHNIPFQVFLPADLNAEELNSFDIVIVFAKPDKEMAERVTRLAKDGKTVVLVDSHGSYPWQTAQRVQVNEETNSYEVGQGKVLELSEPVTDPETFAQDIRRLLGKRNAILSLWNGLTILAAPYTDRSGKLKVLEFINYAADPLQVQVQIKGSFTSVRYETPEHGCCQALVPVKHDEFTEFTIPDLHIAGRVHLEDQ